MHRWMDAWMHTWVDGCMGGWMNGYMGGWKDTCMQEWMNVYIYYIAKEQEGWIEAFHFFSQDRFVPINNVGRSMRNSVPRTAKVDKQYCNYGNKCSQIIFYRFQRMLNSVCKNVCLSLSAS